MGERVSVGVQAGDGWYGAYRHWGSPNAVLYELWDSVALNGLDVTYQYLVAKNEQAATKVLDKAQVPEALAWLHDEYPHDEYPRALPASNKAQWFTITHEDPDPLYIEWVYALSEDGKVAVFRNERCPHGEHAPRKAQEDAQRERADCGCWTYFGIGAAWCHVLIGSFDVTDSAGLLRAVEVCEASMADSVLEDTDVLT